MPANTTPIFPLTPVTPFVSGVPATLGTPGITANTSKDASTGTVYGPIITAAANGSRLDAIKVRALGTNVQTVMRVFINNGGAIGTAANNTLFIERTIAATTVSETTELNDILIQMNISLPAGYKIYATFGTAVAAGFHLTALGGDY